MERSLSDLQAPIGSTVDLLGSFTTTVVGDQVAVEFFVPADYKLLEVISQRTASVSERGYRSPPPVPFTMSDPACQPTHRETRFDRLFLYYETLQPITCDIAIPVLKAYNGSTTVMPMRVYEMYK